MRQLLLECLSDVFLEYSLSACHLVHSLWELNSFESILQHLFLEGNFELSIRAISVFLFFSFSKQNQLSLSAKKIFPQSSSLFENLSVNQLQTSIKANQTPQKVDLDFKANTQHFNNNEEHLEGNDLESTPVKNDSSFLLGSLQQTPGRVVSKYQAEVLDYSLQVQRGQIDSGFKQGLEELMNISDNQSLWSFARNPNNEDDITGNALGDSFTIRDSSVFGKLVRFNEVNSKEIPINLRRKYFSVNKTPGRDRGTEAPFVTSSSNMLSSSFRESLSSLRMSGSRMASFGTDKAGLSGRLGCFRGSGMSRARGLGLDFRQNLCGISFKKEEILSLPPSLTEVLQPAIVMRFLQVARGSGAPPLNEPFEDLCVDNEKVGLSLMLLATGSRAKVPALFAKFMVSAFSVSKSGLQEKILASFKKVLEFQRASEVRLDSGHRRLISDVLFHIFREQPSLFHDAEFAALLLDNGVDHLGFLVMNQFLAVGAQSLNRQARRVKRDAQRYLEINCSKTRLEECAIPVSRYFEVSKKLGLAKDKWGIYSSMFDFNAESLKLLKLKENKNFAPFVEYLKKHPGAFDPEERGNKSKTREGDNLRSGNLTGRDVDPLTATGKTNNRESPRQQLSILKFFRHPAPNQEKQLLSSLAEKTRKMKASSKEHQELRKMIDKEVEDSLFQMGQWRPLTEFIERKHPLKSEKYIYSI